MVPTTLLTLALFAYRVYGAETALFVPGFDPQPLSIDYISTDAKSHTVWALHATGDPANNIDSIPGVFTYVEGSNYMSLGYSYSQVSMTINEECSLASDLAVCTSTSSGSTDTGTISPITKLTATIGTPAPGVPSTTPTSSPTTSPGSSPGASATSITSTASASNSTKSNSARSAKGGYSSGAVYLLTVLLFHFVAL